MRKVRITKAPSTNTRNDGMGAQSTEEVKVNNTLKPTTKDNATLEAEKGETVVTNLGDEGIPELYTVGGKRHYDGGTPLNLPKDSFVFSRDRKLKIKDPEILQEFGKTIQKKGPKGYLPADLSKQYNLNFYRRVLADPNSDKIQRDTAELMIQNYNLKLGGLAMVQESMKGFDRGIPEVAMPYLEHIQMDPASLVQPPQGAQAPMPMARYGGAPNAEAIKKIEHSNSKYYQMGGGTGRLPRGSRVIRMQDGSNAIVDRHGRIIGRLGVPQSQGVPSTSTKTTKSQNIPKDANKWDMNTEGYDESKVSPGDYVKKADGKWYKVEGYNTKETPYQGTYANPNLAGPAGDTQEAFGRLQQTLTENTDLRDAIVAEYKKNMKAAKPNKKTGLTDKDIAQALKMSDDDIINNFLNMEEQVMAVNAQGITKGKDWDESDSWDKSRKNYENTVGKLGFTALEPWQQAAFQGAYIGLQNLADDPKYKEALQDFDISQVGRGDEGAAGRSTISGIDGWVGNTTIGQAAMYKPVSKELDMQEAEWTEEEKQEAVQRLDPNMAPQDAPWFLQDIIKTAGAAGDFFRVDKKSPWEAQAATRLVDGVYDDPTRQLAANAEMAAIGTAGAAAFAGPQAFNARQAQIQGKAAQNVANTMAQVQGRNVAIANQIDAQNAQIMNQAAREGAARATRLFDKNTIANQQFDNAKNMARQALRQNYVDAVTNRANAQVTNQLYEQYNIDPSTGGMMHFTQGRPVPPTKANTTGVSDKFAEYKRLHPGTDDATLYKMAAADMGIPQGPSAMNAGNFAYPPTYPG